MAIGVKVMNRPLERVSYVRATLKGMATTLKHLVDPHKVTMQYPETKWDLSPRWRGTHRMLTTEDGTAKCVACGLCPTVCPANCASASSTSRPKNMLNYLAKLIQLNLLGLF